MNENKVLLIGLVFAMLFIGALFGVMYLDSVNQREAIIKLVNAGASPLEASNAIRGK